MRVDLEAVASFSRTGDEGGQRAAESLEKLTGIAAYCALTRTALVDGDGLSAFLGDSPTRITVGFTGALAGRAVLSFDDAFAAGVAEELSMGDEALPEVANILTSGFVDVWAEQADDTIDIEPPSEVTDEDTVVQDAAVVDDCAFVFESQVTLSSTGGNCRFAVIPDIESFADYLAAGDAALPVDGLSAYLQMTTGSAAAVESHLAAMTGVDADTVESHIDFVPVERVPSLLDDVAYEGAVFESQGPVESVIVVLFDDVEPGAVADTMLTESDPDPELAESAVAELGNVTASGFLDGWANALETTIDVSTPSHVRDDGHAVLDTVAAAYGQYVDTITVVNTTVCLGEDLTCRVCAFPNPEDADTVGEIAHRLTNAESETQ